MAVIASEGGHWYAQDGTPVYEVEKANGGGLRPTTLRDARKLNLVPSVTGILKMQVAPQLEMWKCKQAVMQARKMRKRKDESEEQFAVRAYYEAMQQVRDAADIGSKIHGWCEHYFLTGEIKEGTILGGVFAAMQSHGLSLNPADWHTEKSFARDGFGGKCDLHNESCVLDFKTKDFSEEKLPGVFDNHALQLAAYRHGLGLGAVPGYICFVSHTQAGLSHIVKLSSETLDRGWEIFQHLLALWQIDRRYVPCSE